MAFDIDTFRAELKGGGARPTLFEITLTNPFATKFAGTDRTLCFTARAASMPASTLGTIPISYFGRDVKTAGDRTFAEWTVTVINDVDCRCRGACEEWMNIINGHVSNRRNARVRSATIGDAYKSQAQVKQYDRFGDTPTKMYNFVGLWPSEVGTIELDWNTKDTIEEFQLTLQYDYWVSDSTDQGSVGLGGLIPPEISEIIGIVT